MTTDGRRVTEEFFFLSDILDRPVVDRAGEPLGRLQDVGLAGGEIYPRAVSYYIRTGWFSSVPLAVPAPSFEALPDHKLRLTIDTAAMQPTPRRQSTEILLRREILDQQIVDTDGARVVRVNDVHLLSARGGEVFAVHVDIGFRGLLRRLGWTATLRLLDTLGRARRGLTVEERFISWRYVVPLRAESLPHDLRLNLNQAQLAGLHPAELAEIMEELDRFEGPAVLQALDVPTAARTLAELTPEMQRLLIEALDVKKAAHLIAAMPPDEEADLLEELPEPLRDRLIAALPAQDAATVTDLLTHDPDTAGSMMNPEICTVGAERSVGEVLDLLRAGPAEFVRAYLVAVIDDRRHLLGVLTLPELLRADPAATVDGVMERDPYTVHPEESMKETAELFDRFNLLAAAVTGDDGQFEGVVTVDDVVAWLREGEDREGGLT